ncbi:unnamed protein product [Heterobilharzia americana]|nr:unnamed protein product [Heterobilharzia americana]
MNTPSAKLKYTKYVYHIIDMDNYLHDEANFIFTDGTTGNHSKKAEFSNTFLRKNVKGKYMYDEKQIPLIIY